MNDQFPMTNDHSIYNALLLNWSLGFKTLIGVWALVIGILLLPLAVFAAPSSIQDLTMADTYIQTTHDKIPRLCNLSTPTHVSTKSGNWSDASVWSGGSVPAAGSRVHIASGTTVTYDVTSDAVIGCIEIRDTGHLTFATNQNTKLVLDDGIFVLPGSGGGGKLTIGTQANPIQADKLAEIVFADTPLKTGTVESPGPDPRQYGKVIAVWGEVSMHGAVKNATFERIADQLTAGQTSITLYKPVSGWRAGDTIYIPDSRREDYPEADPSALHNDQLTLAAVSTDGKTLTFAQPLRHDHPCAENNDRSRTRVTNVDPNNPLFNEPLCPHAVNITRNILLRPENPNGTRGHTMMLNRVAADMRYVEFREMDRTHANVLNNSTFDANGVLTSVGTNHIGRYSLHFHHVFGPTNPSNTGYQFQAIGNSFNGSRKWAMTIHDSSFGLVKDNVFIKGEGAPLATEDGSEFGNIIEHNFSGGMDKSPEAATLTSLPAGLDGYSGALGFGMWFAGPFNTIRDNVIAEVRRTSYAVWPPVKGGNVVVPKFRGANTTQAANVETREMNYFGFTEFARNEAYGPQQAGANAGEVLDFWNFGRKIPPEDVSSGIWPAFPRKNSAKPDAEAIFADSTIAWNFSARFSNNYPGSGYEIHNRPLIRGSHDGGQNQDGPGIEGNGSGTKTEVRNGDIEGIGIGIWNNEGSEVEVVGGHIAGTIADVIGAASGNARFGAHTVLRGVVLPGNPRATDPRGRLRFGLPSAGVGIGDGLQTFILYDFNGTTGDNLQIFFPQQAADATIIEASADNTRPFFPACLGLTNRQCWEQHGLAVLGQIATCTTNDRSSEIRIESTRGVEGDFFLCPLITPTVTNVQATNAASDPNTTLGPAGYWKFDEGEGLIGIDSTGGNSATFSSDRTGLTWTTDAAPTIFANPFALAGRASKSTFQINRSYYNEAGYSYSFWVKSPAGPLAEVVADKGGDFPHMKFSRNNDKLQVNVGSNTNKGVLVEKLSQTTVFDGTWHHITWTDQAGQGRLYVDGQEDSSNFTYPTRHRNGEAVPLTLFSNVRLIGGLAPIDDLRTYNRVLAPHEIADLASGQLGDVSQVLASSQQITWDSPNFARFYVQYGLDTNYTNRSPKTTLKTYTLNGLLPSTTYHYRVCGDHSVSDGELTGCSPDSTFTTAASTGSAPPRLVITQPAPGSSFTANDIEVRYVATGDLSGAQADHIHFQLDANPEVRGISLTGGIYTFQDVPAGQHTVTGYLAKADHSKVEGTDVSVSFTVTAPEPAPAPNTSPTISVGQDSFTARIGETLTFIVTAQDDDGDGLTLDIPNLSSLLPGAVFE